jgi:hypothetical protein
MICFPPEVQNLPPGVYGRTFFASLSTQGGADANQFEAATTHYADEKADVFKR